MASVAAENWEYTEINDEFEGLEFSQINQGLLMSFLDETLVDECDDERLSKVIQSLEDEINLGSQDYSYDDESGGRDWSMPLDLDHHINWMDHVEFAAPCSPSADVGEYYWTTFDNSEQELGGTSVLDQWTDDETRFVSSVVIDHTSSFV